MNNKKPKRIGVLLSSKDNRIKNDIWEVVLLYYFLELNNLHVLNIVPPTIELSGELRSELVDAGYSLGDFVVADREVGKEIAGLFIPTFDKSIIASGSDIHPKDDIRIDNDLRRFVREVFRRRKPIAASGLGAFFLAVAISDITESSVSLTVGNDPIIESYLERRECNTINTRGGEVIIDETNHLITTAGHYCERKIKTVFKGLENLVAGFVHLKNSGA
ncbi:MAG: hypothetical protein GF315_01340 [candidate division Zixibacteria bacterium]|nr:hypothetical protein [candidate division Zixibacteria bacterium]